MLTTKQGIRDGYDFTKDGTVTFIQDGTCEFSVFWKESSQKWVFVDHLNQEVDYADRIAAVRLREGEDADGGLNQAALAIDLEGEGLWIVPVEFLEDLEADENLDSYLEVVFREV